MVDLPPLAADDVAKLLTTNVKRLDGKDATAFNQQAKALKEMRNLLVELLGRVQALEDDVVDPEPPSPPPTIQAYAPRTYNKSASGDARFCVAGLPKDASGAYVDAMGVRYDSDGKDLGGRDGSRIVPGIKGSDMMDDNGPCDPYEWQGRFFPPWPAESYLR